MTRISSARSRNYSDGRENSLMLVSTTDEHGVRWGCANALGLRPHSQQAHARCLYMLHLARRLLYLSLSANYLLLALP